MQSRPASHLYAWLPMYAGTSSKPVDQPSLHYSPTPAAATSLHSTLCPSRQCARWHSAPQYRTALQPPHCLSGCAPSHSPAKLPHIGLPHTRSRGSVEHLPGGTASGGGRADQRGAPCWSAATSSARYSYVLRSRPDAPDTPYRQETGPPGLPTPSHTA